jgi:hypothetical protein
VLSALGLSAVEVDTASEAYVQPPGTGRLTCIRFPSRRTVSWAGTVCHGSCPASGSTRAQAALAASVTRARSAVSRTCPASVSTRRIACRRSHCSTRSSPGWVNGRSVDRVPIDRAVHRHLDRSVQHGPGPQAAGPGDPLGRAVLRLDLGRAERRVRDLEHAEHAPGRLSQQEVAVLLAAQRLRSHRQAERGRDPFGLLGRDLRHRQRAVPEEVGSGRRCIFQVRGRRQSGLPCRRRPAAAARRAPRRARAAR